MVTNRCLAPISKLAVIEHIERDVFISSLAQIGVQVLYRAMDFFIGQSGKLEQGICWSVADLLNVEINLLFFDTTSTYFATEA